MVEKSHEKILSAPVLLAKLILHKLQLCCCTRAHSPAGVTDPAMSDLLVTDVSLQVTDCPECLMPLRLGQQTVVLQKVSCG